MFNKTSVATMSIRMVTAISLADPSVSTKSTRAIATIRSTAKKTVTHPVAKRSGPPRAEMTPDWPIGGPTLSIASQLPRADTAAIRTRVDLLIVLSSLRGVSESAPSAEMCSEVTGSRDEACVIANSLNAVDPTAAPRTTSGSPAKAADQLLPRARTRG